MWSAAVVAGLLRHSGNVLVLTVTKFPPVISASMMSFEPYLLGVWGEVGNNWTKGRRALKTTSCLNYTNKYAKLTKMPGHNSQTWRTGKNPSRVHKSATSERQCLALLVNGRSTFWAYNKGGELVHTLSVQCENVVRLGVQAGLKIETKFTNRLANPSLIGFWTAGLKWLNVSHRSTLLRDMCHATLADLSLSFSSPPKATTVRMAEITSSAMLPALAYASCSRALSEPTSWHRREFHTGEQILMLLELPYNYNYHFHYFITITILQPQPPSPPPSRLLLLLLLLTATTITTTTTTTILLLLLLLLTTTTTTTTTTNYYY